MRALAWLVTTAALSLPLGARAQEGQEGQQAQEAPQAQGAQEEPAPAPQDSHAPLAKKSGWVDVFATGYVGDGLRFNNPYRLATVLGSTAQSLSRTAMYTDLGGALVLGDPTFLAHGLALRVSVSLEGVQQSVVTPSYLVLHRWGSWAAYGRAGGTIVVTPDTTWGFEGAAGAVWFVRAGVGVSAELVGDVFYGAGTRDVAVATYPVLSAQAGLWLSFEAMP
jgi:hypothetical protein